MKALCYATLFFILSVTSPLFASTASDIFDKASKSTVVILAYDNKDEVTGLGSGVVLPDGSIATNCHVIEDVNKISVRYQNKEYPAEKKYTDWDRDICSVTAKGLRAQPVNIGSTQGLRVGSQVYAIGAPRGLELTISDGIISSLRPIEGGQYIQITAPISPGSSGGGLYNSEGKLLGLTSFYIGEGQNLNFALPVEWIGELPDRHVQTLQTEKTSIDWFNKGWALYDKEGWQGVINHAEEWTKAEPNNYLAWQCLGEAYQGTGRHQEATDAFRQAIRIDPEYADAWYNLGIVYLLNLGRHQEATDAFRQAIQIDPEFAMAWNNLGAVYNKLNRHQEAIDAYRQAIRIDPEYADAWYNLGEVYNKLNRHQEAIDAYRQAIRIDPEYADAWYNLGNACLNLGRHQEAIDAYRQAIQIGPEYADAWNNLGAVYNKLNRHQEATDAFRQAVRIDPENADAWYNLGIVYLLNLGRHQEATDAFRQAIRIDPENADAWYYLAIAYYMSGNRTAALEVVQTLRQLDPVRAERLFDAIVPR